SLPLFFFFQAEDGIRDFHVTRVQTCALPILSVFPREVGAHPLTSASTCASASARPPHGTKGYPRRPWELAVRGSDERRLALSRRSEERRVGKECRSGWAPSQ